MCIPFFSVGSLTRLAALAVGLLLLLPAEADANMLGGAVHRPGVTKVRPGVTEKPGNADVQQPEPAEIQQPEPVELQQPDPVAVQQPEPVEVQQPDMAETPPQIPEQKPTEDIQVPEMDQVRPDFADQMDATGPVQVQSKGKWRLETQILQPGTRSQGQHGRLWYGENEMPGARGQILETELGRLEYRGSMQEREQLWSSSGWVLVAPAPDLEQGVQGPSAGSPGRDGMQPLPPDAQPETP